MTVQNSNVTACQWTIGWRTPTCMGTSYILACIVAAIHGVLCNYLVGRPAEGPSAQFTQRYATTVSVILASIFGLLLRWSLNVSFAQYLWHLLRVTPLKLSTIEALFTMRSNLLSLYSACAVWNATPLVLITIIMWSIPIAMSFPSSSLTVVASTREDVVADAVVPTFNAADAGNRSYAYISSRSISTFSYQTDPHDEGTTNIWYGAYPELTPDIPFDMQYLVNGMLTSAAILNMPSPCGANCSYTLQFTGPYLQCTSTDVQRTIERNITELSRAYPGITFMAYNSTLIPEGAADADPSTQAHLHFMTARATDDFAVQVDKSYMNGSEEVSDRRYKAEIVESHLDCVPSKAEYTVEMAYRENIQHVTLSTDVSSVRPISNLSGRHLVVPGTSYTSYQSPGLVNSTAINFFEDANLATLIYAMAQKLTGTFDANLAAISSTETDESRHDYQHVEATVSPNFYELNQTNKETLLTLTQYFSPFQLSSSDRINILYPQTSSIFTVNATTLNNILANITLSTIPFTNHWSTNATQTRVVPVNVYAFSQPLNLILPYALLLGCGLCALVLGGWALRANGVAATDGGFLQILTTTRGSADVDRVAKGCCLGSEENWSSEMMSLRVKFGEMEDPAGPGLGEDTGRKIAGFGVAGEVSSLRKRGLYGGP